WSPDGRQLALVEGSGATRRGRTFTHNPWWDVVLLPADGGSVRRIARIALPAGSGPERVQRRAIPSASWGPEGRVFYPQIADGGTLLVSVDTTGGDRRIHMVFPSADEAAPSPDGRWVAFQEDKDVYLTP